MTSASNQSCFLLGEFQLFPDSSEFCNFLCVYLIAECFPFCFLLFIIMGKTIMAMIAESSVYCGSIFTASIFQGFYLASFMQRAF
ncbi:MAG: hypothetical protein A2X83_06085 [Desulfuromonadales bacterium GWD2_54_10]|nr:MAG: hypothetical protein A2X83_06085 [Desulfuromonadales bacterium GWD2_54_10]